MSLRILLLDDCQDAAQALRGAMARHTPDWQLHTTAQLEMAQTLVGGQQVDVVLVALGVQEELEQDLPALWPSVSLWLWVPPEALARRALRPGYAQYVLQDHSPQGLALLIERLRAMADTVQAHQSLQQVLESMSQGIVLVDAQGRVRMYNSRMQELLELPEELLAGNPTMDAVMQWQNAHGALADEYLNVDTTGKDYLRTCMDGASYARAAPARYLRHTADGRCLEVRTRMLPEGGLVRTYADVTDYMSTQEALRRSEERWRSLTQLSSDWYWEQDAELRFVRFEGSMPDNPYFSSAEHYGLRRWELPDAVASPEQWRAHRALLQERRPFTNFEFQRQSVDGTIVWASVSGEPVFDAQGQFTGYRGVARNITAQKQAEAEIQRLAYVDELTRLPNRRMLAERLEQAVARCGRSASHAAVLYLDLDDFKRVNDSLGHEWGDELLRQAGVRLAQAVRASDTVARVGGDEFVLVLQGLDDDPHQAAAQAEAVAQKIQASLNQPYTLKGEQAHAPPSIGMALFRGKEHTVLQLLQKADMAMYQAKAQGLNAPCFFDPQMQSLAETRAVLEAEVRQGLQLREFEVHYQPVVDASGKVLGVEALVRWLHPQRGLVLPGEFIGLCEQNGLVIHLGQQVLMAACAQLAAWASHPVRLDWTVAVNVSAREFRHPNFVEQVLQTLRHTGADASLLRLELTESMLLTDVEDAIAKMQALRHQGVCFSLDDFGTGYSSLSYLKRLPLDQLKIDQGFVRDLLTDANDAAIACTVIALAHSLGLEVVAEGVETPAQRKFLLRNGCQRFQGYLFGRPVPAAQLPE